MSGSGKNNRSRKTVPAFIYEDTESTSQTVDIPADVPNTPPDIPVMASGLTLNFKKAGIAGGIYTVGANVIEGPASDYRIKEGVVAALSTVVADNVTAQVITYLPESAQKMGRQVHAAVAAAVHFLYDKFVMGESANFKTILLAAGSDYIAEGVSE